MSAVLIVEDQASVRYALRLLFTSQGLTVLEASSPDEALRMIAKGAVGVVVQDMNFEKGATSGEEGISLFRALRELVPELPIILLTAWASIETAVLLTKEGATDYVPKPWNDEKLVATVKAYLAVGVPSSTSEVEMCGAVFASKVMQRSVELAARIARESVSVLLLGPNGTGKEKLAEIIQSNSPRKNAPFVRVNAGALPDSLLEAELFGAEAGAFTGATKMRLGRFEEADGGTLFLDEIGNLSLAGQMRLLRVLQTGEFERLGSAKTRRVDVRLISATNLDIYAAVRSGAFREDLLYRINVFELRIPPLAQRPDDILPIARALLDSVVRERRLPPFTLTARAERRLLEHRWPGNVRELSNAITRAIVLSGSPVIDEEHFAIVDVADTERPGSSASAKGEPSLAEIRASLEKWGGNVRAVSQELGLSRQALYRRVERAGLALDTFRDATGDQSDQSDGGAGEGR